MEKKHISILGSCVSRELFNNSILSQVFDIDNYFYQVCIWDLFGDKINISKEELLKFYKEEFTARMICCDFNKNVPQLLKESKSEYLLLDLYNIIQNVVEMKYNNKIIYTQFSYDRYSCFFENLDKISEIKDKNKFEHLSYSYKEADDSMICGGLDKLANFIKNNYKAENVIINIPEFSRIYIDKDDKIGEYNESDLRNGNACLNVIEKYSYYLKEKIPGCKILEFSDLNLVAQKNRFDSASSLIPPQMHYCITHRLNKSEKLLSLLNIDFKEYNQMPESVLMVDYEYAKLHNQYLKTIKGEFAKNITTHELSLNDYVERIENIADFIIIISAKDEASYSLPYFTNKDILGLEMPIKFRGSYIAIIDKSRNFIKETCSEEGLIFEYKNNLPNDSSVLITSQGYNSGNKSSIILKSKNSSQELSQNRRGLNIVLLNATTLEVVDSFSCDTHLDKELKIKSMYFDKVKIKI